jgi:hypothetical protein
MDQIELDVNNSQESTPPCLDEHCISISDSFAFAGKKTSAKSLNASNGFHF